jgi:hypothetical protein
VAWRETTARSAKNVLRDRSVLRPPPLSDG